MVRLFCRNFNAVEQRFLSKEFDGANLFEPNPHYKSNWIVLDTDNAYRIVIESPYYYYYVIG